MFSLLCVGLLVLYVSKRIRIDGWFPMKLAFIAPLSPLGASLPTTRWNLGLAFTWRDRQTLYCDTKLKTRIVTPLGNRTNVVYSANLATFRQVLGNNSAFYKPLAAIKELQFLGVNVVASEDDEWKRHRRIVAPAFIHTTYQNVWSTTAHVYNEMVKKEGWISVKEARIADTNVITHKLALFIITTVGFDIPMSWDMTDRDESDRLTVQGMVFQVSKTIRMRARTPKVAYFYKGYKALNECDEAYRAFEKFMEDRIASREDELRKLRSMEEGDISDGIRDVFGRLVNARLSDGKLALSDSEIIGNCFILVFAGHETTAWTLSVTMGLLSAFPEVQDWVYDSIKRALGDREPTFEDYDVLDDVLSCFYEALRMYPSAYLMIRQAKSDTTLKLPRTDDPNVVEEVAIPKDTRMCLDLIGMGYDAQTFPDPDAYQPWRWSKVKEQETESIQTETQASEVSDSSSATALEGFVGFSFGPRTCLGHKFAKIEAVCFLTHLIRDWKLEPELLGSETRQDDINV